MADPYIGPLYVVREGPTPRGYVTIWNDGRASIHTDDDPDGWKHFGGWDDAEEAARLLDATKRNGEQLRLWPDERRSA